MDNHEGGPGIAVVGAGRIGRLFLRQALFGPRKLPIRAIIDIEDPYQIAALMEFDTIYGHTPERIGYEPTEQAFDFGTARRVRFHRAERN
jgi:glyceraldehyde-3-phosphate dehydrogenase/erythrose-4-phosphate dehydrogenase